MNVVSVEKPSLKIQPSVGSSHFPKERNPMSVIYVENCFLSCRTIQYIIGVIQKRSPMDVMNVGKNSTTDQLSIAIKEFTGEGI